MDFCTLGMFIIDEIHFPPPRSPVYDIVGGAGTFSALGARLLSPAPDESKRVGWIVDCGSDFPSKLRDVIDSWESGCLLRETPERLTTRGWNHFGENEHRAFRYMTPKLRLDHDDLNSELLLSKAFHLICSPIRCQNLVQNINSRRKEHLEQLGKTDVEPPQYIWEPVPDICTPNDLQDCLEALRLVDVVSPNHQELTAFFEKDAVKDDHVNHKVIEECVGKWLAAGVGKDGKGAVVVRAGKDGCYVSSKESSIWLRAYHTSSEKVVDPTGGGNGFLGGFAVGLVRTGSVEEAALWGSVAASFAIEQIGMPSLGQDSNGETWNGVHVFERLAEFKKRTQGAI